MEGEAYVEIIGEELRTIREAGNFTVPEVARKLKMSPATIYNWESGKTKISTPAFMAYCLALGEHPSDIMRRVEQTVLTEADNYYYD